MDDIEQLYDYKGYKIRLHAHEGVYEGIIGDVCLDPKKLYLWKVKAIEPKEFEFSDIQSFYPRDIRSYDILCDASEALDAKLSSENHSKQRSHSYQNKKKNFIFDDISDTESVISQPDEVPEVEDEKEFVLELPGHLRKRLPIDHVIINEVDDTFRQAISHISNECTIGVSFEGKNIGRHGKLYWIGISTRICTFLFNIDSLKENAFSSGLKSIMESAGILKVIHDSRQPSDCLQHQFNTTLKKVFDKQVADAFVSMQYTGRLSDEVQPVHVCARSYLNLEMKDIYAPMTPRTIAGGTLNWEFTSLKNELRDRMIKNVIYLMLLREELIDHLLQPVYECSDAFLNVVKNSSEKELKLLVPSVPHLMPESVLSAGLQVLHVKSFANGSLSSDNSHFKKFGNVNQCFEAAGKFQTTNGTETGHMKASSNEDRPKSSIKRSNKTSRSSCPANMGTMTNGDVLTKVRPRANCRVSASDSHRTNSNGKTERTVENNSSSDKSSGTSTSSDTVSVTSSSETVTSISNGLVSLSSMFNKNTSSVPSSSNEASSALSRLLNSDDNFSEVRDFSHYKIFPAGMRM